MTHFPVLGAHAREPEGVVDEQPLLLSPYDQMIDPFQHLEFDATGQALPHGGSRTAKIQETLSPEPAGAQ